MRTAGLAVVALVLATAAGCGGSSAREHAVSATSAGAAGALRYAVLGDSYSNGQSAGAGAAWPDQMAALLRARGLPVTVVANPSVTGATTAQMLATGLGPIRDARPDVMTVMLGVNDQVQGTPPAAFARDLARAIREAVAITGARRRVLVVDIPDYAVTPAAAQFGPPARIAADVDRYNAIVAREARRAGVREVSIVDISRRLGGTRAALADDGLHPSRAQLARWAARIAPVALAQWRGLPRG